MLRAQRHGRHPPIRVNGATGESASPESGDARPFSPPCRHRPGPGHDPSASRGSRDDETGCPDPGRERLDPGVERPGGRDATMTQDPERFVSAGSLPPTRRPRHARRRHTSSFGSVPDGSLSVVYPALATADPDLFGLSVASTNGDVVEAGDAQVPFTDDERDQAVRLRPRLRAARHRARTPLRRRQRHRHGLQLDRPGRAGPAGRTNPMVNAGAIATTSLVAGRDVEERWATVHDGTVPLRRETPRAWTSDPALGPRHQPPQPGARQHAGCGGSGGGRSPRRRRGLHPAELPVGHGRRPRRHGRDPRRRRDQPGDRRPGRRSRRPRTPRWP